MLAIASDPLARHQSLSGLRILDVGCNNGLVAKVLSALGCSVVGIDNGDVDGQGLYSDLQSHTELQDLSFTARTLLNSWMSNTATGIASSC